ncbi:MAG TPA: TMEM165/GDT1 family protein [Rhodocyclaceae bacterium]|jgi:putative Ca2+/H+ antiporter (TMEM165/GDT1 family)|nr:TMEM165/GDT1 family protein [Rhodocyclaceae bacterium]
MDALIASFSMVALAEMGDKTQLLSFLLTSRYPGRPWPLIAGIFCATIVNHLVSAALGGWIATHANPDYMRWGLGIAFLAFGAWALIPDKFDEEEKPSNFGPFFTTVVAFFIAEIGDKTQFATVALGAQYSSLTQVVIGTTLGMMAANVPAVLLGQKLTRYIPLSKMRFVAAALFAVFGVLVLCKVKFGLGLGM